MELIASGAVQVSVLAVCVLVAGIVRGCIGFGFSALVVASTSLFLEPSSIVPVVVLLEIVASLQMAFRVWRDVLWKLLLMLMFGVAIGTPIGVYFLSIAHPNTLRLVLSIILLAMTVTLSVGYIYSGPMNRTVLTVMGTVSGVFNGIAGIGGMPVAIFLASAKLPIRQIRASMVIFLLATEVAFLLSASFGGLYNREVFNTSLLAIVPLAAGLILGARLFGILNESVLRRIVVGILLLLSIIGIVRALV